MSEIAFSMLTKLAEKKVTAADKKLEALQLLSDAAYLMDHAGSEKVANVLTSMLKKASL